MSSTVSCFDAMLIENLAGLVLVRGRTVALRFGGAMGKPLFGGVAFGLAACGALAGDPQVDDFSHIRARLFAEGTMVSFNLGRPPICANCADTVAGRAGIPPPPATSC